jgi:hypothetical protein
MAASGTLNGTYSAGDTYTLGYADKTVTRQYGSAYGGYNTASATILGHSLSVGKVTWSVPALPDETPTAPTIGTPARLSDAKQTVKWTRHASTSAPYATQNVQRRTHNGSWGNWTTIATDSSTDKTSGSQTHTDTTTVENRVYQYRVKANNSSGSATSSASVYVFTTPSAPSSITAAKNADGDIIATVTQAVLHTEYVTEWQYSTDAGDSWTTFATTTAGVLSATLSSPSDTSYVFRARVVVDYDGGVGDGLESAWSSVSAAVSVLQAPNPPLVTIGDGSGTLDRDQSVTIYFTHQPMDTTPQTQAEARWRVNSGDWTIIALTTATSATVDALGISELFEAQVRTKGSYEDFSEWSAIASAGLVARPTVTLSAPAETVEASRAPWAFAYYNADGSIQVAARLRLYQDTTLLETNAGTSATEGKFSTALSDATTYSVEVEARAANGLWSATSHTIFTTDFPEPATAQVVASWNSETGTNVLSVEVADVTDDTTTPESVDILWWNNEASEWQTVIDGMDVNSSVTHTTPYLDANRYKAITRTSLPSDAEGDELTQTVNEKIWHYINWGDSLENVVRAGAEPSRKESLSLEKMVIQPSGATWPSVLRGKARTNEITQDLTITPTASQEEDWRTLAYADSGVCLRTPIRRIIGELTGLDFTDSGEGDYSVSLTIQQTGV